VSKLSSTSKRILVVDDSPLVTKMLQARLTAGGYEVRTASDGVSGLEVVQEWLPDLVISDVMMPNMDGREFCRRLRQQPETANLPILMLTAQGGVSEKVAGFEAGADDYVTKPFEFPELDARLTVLLARARAQQQVMEPTERKGELLACFSPRGGVGTTTTAVNLAVSLAQMWQTETALVDLALPIGQVAVMTDLRPSYTLGQMAQETGDLDNDLVLQAMLPHDSGVRILSAPLTPELSDLITSQLAKGLLSVLLSNFALVIVDAGGNFNDVALTVLENADRIILLLAPELASLQATVVTLNVFRELDYDLEKFWPVLSWVFPRQAIPQKEMERALGIPIRTVIPYDSPSVIQAINRGSPLVTEFPKSPVAAAIEDLAYHLSAETQLSRPRQTESPVLARVRKRLHG